MPSLWSVNSGGLPPSLLRRPTRPAPPPPHQGSCGPPPSHPLSPGSTATLPTPRGPQHSLWPRNPSLHCICQLPARPADCSSHHTGVGGPCLPAKPGLSHQRTHRHSDPFLIGAIPYLMSVSTRLNSVEREIARLPAADPQSPACACPGAGAGALAVQGPPPARLASSDQLYVPRGTGDLKKNMFLRRMFYYLIKTMS